MHGGAGRERGLSTNACGQPGGHIRNVENAVVGELCSYGSDMHRPRSHRADVQGLRAVAVGLVVLEHVTGAPPGGFIGVDVFFVISGFLITDLLLREHRDTRRVSLSRFALRRIRRLVPTAAVVLVTSLVAASFIVPPVRLRSMLLDGAWSAASLANWHFAAEQTDHFASDGHDSPFLHFWSLSVEEQFSVVTPVMLVLILGRRSAVGRRRVATALVAAVTIASFGSACVLSNADPSVAYFSTAARAWELGAGALLAFARPWLRGSSPTLGRIAGWVGLVIIIASAFLVPAASGFAVPWASVPVVGALLVLAGGITRDARPPSVLLLRPVTALGDVSHALYLWHLPVLVLLAWSAPEAQWLTIPLSCALAVTTHRLVERPGTTAPWTAVHWRSSLEHRQQWRVWGTIHHSELRRYGVAALTMTTLLLTVAATARLRPADLPLGSADPVALPTTSTATGTGTGADDVAPQVITDRQRALRTALAAVTWSDTTPSVDDVSAPKYLESLVTDPAWSDVIGCSAPASKRSLESCTFGAPEGRLAILVGDSTAAFTMPAFRALAERPGSGWQVMDLARTACPFTAADLVFADDPTCSAHREHVVDVIRERQPDLVLVMNTSSVVEDDDGDQVSDADWARDVGRITSRFRDRVGTTAIVLPNPPGPDTRTCALRSPSACVTRPAAGRRAAYETISGVSVVDTAPLWCSGSACPDVVADHLVRVDAIHVTPQAAVDVAPALRQLLVDLMPPP